MYCNYSIYTTILLINNQNTKRGSRGHGVASLKTTFLNISVNPDTHCSYIHCNILFLGISWSTNYDNLYMSKGLINPTHSLVQVKPLWSLFSKSLEIQTYKNQSLYIASGVSPDSFLQESMHLYSQILKHIQQTDKLQLDSYIIPSLGQLTSYIQKQFVHIINMIMHMYQNFRFHNGLQPTKTTEI